jgi:hypothetical protein
MAVLQSQRGSVWLVLQAHLFIQDLYLLICNNFVFLLPNSKMLCLRKEVTILMTTQIPANPGTNTPNVKTRTLGFFQMKNTYQEKRRAEAAG